VIFISTEKNGIFSDFHTDNECMEHIQLVLTEKSIKSQHFCKLIAFYCRRVVVVYGQILQLQNVKFCIFSDCQLTYVWFSGEHSVYKWKVCFLVLLGSWRLYVLPQLQCLWVVAFDFQLECFNLIFELFFIFLCIYFTVFIVANLHGYVRVLTWLVLFHCDRRVALSSVTAKNGLCPSTLQQLA